MSPETLPDFSAEALRIIPLARAETIPARWYTDPRFHAFDGEAVFMRSWQYIGHEGLIPHAGDYVLATVAGNPVIVVRGHEEEIRAYYNVCRHRGGPLATQERGNVRMLQCQYHGWTYRLDGCLRGVPRFDRTELFDKADYGLIPVAVAIWQGLLFVNLSDRPLPLAELMEGIEARIAPLDLRHLSFYRRVWYEVACNWKVYVDNYLEGYHLPLVHPELCDALDYRSYATETARYYSLQYSPLRAGEGVYGEGEAFYYYAFPNTMLNILPDRLQMNRVLPVSHDRTRVLFDYYYADVASAGAIRKIEEDLDFSDRVQQEDIEICEHVQLGLQSRAYDRGRFSVECEQGVYHFQCLLKEAYRLEYERQGHEADLREVPEPPGGVGDVKASD